MGGKIVVRSQVLKIFTEHSSILLSLHAAKLDIEDHPGRILFAWSDTQALAMKPISAVLHIPGTVLIRLPVTLSDLNSVVDYNHHIQTTCIDKSIFDTSLGQLEWALSSFENDISKRDYVNAIQRLLEIQCFCDDNWPGWFNYPLLYLHESVQLAPYRITSLITVLMEYANIIALVDCFHSFQHISTIDISNGAIGACSALIKYSLTGTTGLDSESMDLVKAMLIADVWWRNMPSMFVDIAEKIERSGSCGVFVEQIKAQIDSILILAPSLVESLEMIIAGKTLYSTGIVTLNESLDKLIRLISQVEAQKARLITEFEERLRYD